MRRYITRYIALGVLLGATAAYGQLAQPLSLQAANLEPAAPAAAP